jgi:hypothetical protein
MTETERLAEIAWRARELAKQLEERARLYGLMKAPEIADEFKRLYTAEVVPIMVLAEGRIP